MILYGFHVILCGFHVILFCFHTILYDFHIIVQGFHMSLFGSQDVMKMLTCLEIPTTTESRFGWPGHGQVRETIRRGGHEIEATDLEVNILRLKYTRKFQNKLARFYPHRSWMHSIPLKPELDRPH